MKIRCQVFSLRLRRGGLVRGRMRAHTAGIMIRKLILLSLAFPAGSIAELAFEKKEAQVSAKPSDESLLIEFPFVNKGKVAASVEDITFACSCLSAKTNKKEYAPSEEGVLEAVFKLGSFTGVQRKSLTVVSREKGAEVASRDSLTVEVTIPDVIVIEPQLMSWQVGAKPEGKKFTLKIPHDDPITVKGVTCSRPGFDVKLVEKKAGREYEIELTPKSTAVAMLGMLKIETDCTIPKHQRKLAFFSIARKRKS